MVELIPAKCPNCGADLQFPEGMEVGHCIHCDGKVIIDKNEPAPSHYHQDTHHHYESNNSNFEKLKYNKEQLEKEIEDLKIYYHHEKGNVDALGQEWLEASNSQKDWAKYFFIGAIVSLVFITYETLCCSGLFLILLIIGIWLYFFSSASTEYDAYSEAKKNFDQLTLKLLEDIKSKENELELLEQRMRDWR